MSETVMKSIIEAISALGVALIGTFSIKKYKKNNNKTQKLKYHPVFQKIEFNKDLVQSFDFKNKGKELVFKEILNTHLEIYNKMLKEFVEAVDSAEDMDSNELTNRAVAVISDIRDEILTFYENDKSYTEDEREAIKIVIAKYNNWNINRDKNMFEMVSQICGSSFYNTTYGKAVTILDLFSFSIIETIDDANKTLQSLNGDLKGLKFKGVVI